MCAFYEYDVNPVLIVAEGEGINITFYNIRGKVRREKRKL